MDCPEGTLVQHFVAGRLDDGLVALFEAHIEQCEECFLRLAAAASEVSQQARGATQGSTRGGARPERCIAGSLADDLSDAATALLSRGERKKVGAYVVTGVLGMGGMGIVYRARHEDTGREVALKTVKMPWLASSLAMLRQEIAFLRQARHPRIVAIVDFDLHADEPWYAMELFEGHTLREYNQRSWASSVIAPGVEGSARALAANGRLVETLRLFERLCEPVDFVHRGGMVHCDIKPSNVFLRSDTEPVLMDFGLASRARGTVGREALVVTGRLRGSLPYVAPEIIRGRIPDTRADLYALGCMLYESVVGTPPFASASGVEIIDMHLRRPPVPASQLAAGVPPELDALLLRLLAKNPYERFGHASALAAALGRMADALSPAPAPPRARPSAQPTMLFRPPLVGRDHELAIVEKGLHRARHRASGTLFLVSGQSGIGKTFFTAEVGQRAALAGMQVITGECLPLVLGAEAPADAGRWPLQGFHRFFEGLRERCHELGQTEIDRLFGDRLPVLASSLPVLRHLCVDVGPLEPPAPLPAAAARERIVAAVVDTLVSYASRGPTLVAIDDLHWADDLTLAVLERLDPASLDAVPLVIVANYRSEEAGDVVRRLANEPGRRVLQLGRLAAPELRALVGGMLSMSTPPEPLVEFIDAHSEGIPFFAAEYLRSLVAAGGLVYEGGTWSTFGAKLQEFSASRRTELPRTLQDLIRGRLGRLATEAVSLLEAGAVIGRRFSVSLLGRMLGEPSERWTPLLEAAVALQVTNSEDFETYTFLHDKIREALYSGLAEQRRMELHLAAAHALEQSGSVPDEYGPIAHHFRQAGDVLHALEYLEKAGEHALAIAANADAERFFAEALEIEAGLPERQPRLRRARWLRQRGDALGGLGRMTDSAAALEASAALLGRPLPRSKPGFAARLAREVATQVWHRLRRRPPAPLAGLAAELDLEIMRVFERLHEVSYYLGRDADVVLSTTMSLNSSERVGATPSLAIAYSNAAMLAGVLPVPFLADHYFRLAAAATQAAPDVSAESWMLEMAGAYHTWRGERHEGVCALQRSIQLARQGGHYRRCDEAECVLIALDLMSGFHDQVLTRTAGVLASVRKRNDLQIQGWLLLAQCEAHLIRGDLDAAQRAVEAVQPLLQTLGRPERILATGLEANIRHRQGDREARAYVERALALILGGQPVHSSCFSAYDRLAETAVDIYRNDEPSRGARDSRALAEKACAILKRIAGVFPVAGPAAVLHRGTLDLVAGRRPVTKVLDEWRRAADQCRAWALPYPELRLRWAILARSTPGEGHHPSHLRIAELLGELRLAHAVKAPVGSEATQSAA